MPVSEQQPGDTVTRYFSGSNEQYRPDFVMVGLPAPGGVELWASTELSYAELEAVTRYRPYEFEELIGRIDYPPPTQVSRTITLRAGIGKFVIVRAPTYPEALAALLRHPGWGPGGQLAIGSPEVTGG